MRSLFTMLLVGLCGLSSAQDFGPIATRNHRSLSLPFLRIAPKAGVLAKGERLLDASWTVANEFRGLPAGGPYTVYEDGETSRFDFVWREGLGRGREWSVEAPILVRGGGFLDPIISWWHEEVLGLANAGRRATPEGRCLIGVPGARFGAAWGLGDVSGSLSQDLGRGLTATVSLKLPTGNARQLLGSGAVDAGAALDWHKRLAHRWDLHVQGGFVAQGRATDLPHSRDWVHQESTAFVFRPNSRDAWIAQWQGEASALETGVAGSDATHRILTFGYRRRLSDRRSVELFFSEDGDIFNGSLPEAASVGPDFTAGARLLVRF